MGQVISYIWPSSTPQETEKPAEKEQSAQSVENQTETHEAPAQVQQEQQPAQPANPPPAKPRIDRSIFVQKNKTDETIVRVPGQINGNQFNADKLENCKVIVHDFCDSMMIDRCTNCEFVLSAVRGSIFARNCTNCKFALVCGQFRCRECVDCDVYMHVKTGPVIESSQNLKIGCALVNYPELEEQMKKAKLDPAVNIWNDIHDFTPGEGHYSLSVGEKLEMDILKNDAAFITPFTYSTTGDGTKYNAKIEEKYWMNLVQSSLSTLKIADTHREADGNFSVDIEAPSDDDVRTLLSEFEPISITMV